MRLLTNYAIIYYNFDEFVSIWATMMRAEFESLFGISFSMHKYVYRTILDNDSWQDLKDRITDIRHKFILVFCLRWSSWLLFSIALCHKSYQLFASSSTCIEHWAVSMFVGLFPFSFVIHKYLTPFGCINFCHGNLLKITEPANNNNRVWSMKSIDEHWTLNTGNRIMYIVYA